MKKIPTVFERDWDGDRSRVLPEVVEGCEWVIAGEGVATRKYDGTACAIIAGDLYRRESIRIGKPWPETFLFVAHEIGVDGKPGKDIGWVPVGDGPADKWHREAFENLGPLSTTDGTLELVGPKINGNPERFLNHFLVRHDMAEAFIVPRTFEGMRDLLEEVDVEGFVFQHEDGRMAKIKKRDFGISRKPDELPEDHDFAHGELATHD